MSHGRLGGILCTSAKKAGAWLGVGIAALLVCPPLFSQSNQGNIQGTVVDQTGGAIAGATVTVTDVARGVARTLTTDSGGQYAARGLTPSTYTVRAEAKGFSALERSGVLVEVGQDVRLDLEVRPGEQTQTVTVTEEVPLINASDATIGGTMSNQEINELPLNGRNFNRLLQLRPGTVGGVGGGQANGVQTNGRRGNNNQLRVNGIVGMAQAQGSDVLNAQYRVGDASSLIPIDAIQEFSTQQNPKAEYGFRDGGVVNVGVKSGTNSLHGTAYAFGRDAKATDAANFFTKTVSDGVMQQFGATAGGPIIKDKLFWFAGYEGLRMKVGSVSVNTIPADVSMATAANPAGNKAFSMVDACRALGPASISPLSAQISGLNPTTCVVTPASSTVENLWPYTTDTTLTGNFLDPALGNSGPLNNGLIKGDYNINSHHHISGMYFVSRATQVANSISGQLSPQWVTLPVVSAQQFDGSWTWTSNSSWVNDFRMGYVYAINKAPLADQNIVASDPWPNGYGLKTGVTDPFYGGMPQLTINTFTGFLGGGNRASERGPEGDLDLVENVSYLRGNHSFKFGLEYIDIVLKGNTYSQAQGSVTFTDLSTFLQGLPLSGTILLGDPSTNLRSHWYAGYVQDDWRIRRRLTLNLGLRYEYAGAPSEVNNYLGNFNPDVNPATTPAVQQVGSGAPLSSLYEAGKKNFSPRLGVAWDVQGNGKTVVRGGAGYYRNPASLRAFTGSAIPFGANFPSIGVNNSGTVINAHTPVQPSLTGCGVPACGFGQLNWTTAGPIFPSNSSQVISGVTYTGATCTAALPCPMPATDPHFRDPYSIQWNLGIQRAITNGISLEVTYVGNHGKNEQTMIDPDQPAVGTGWTGTPTTNCLASASLNYNNCKVSAAQFNAARQYVSKFPYIKYVGFVTNGAFSNYNGMNVTVRGRGYRGLSFLVGYTYAHALSVADANTSSGISVVQDKNNLRSSYGNSGSDLRHRFTFSPSYQIPGIKSPAQMLQGWSLSAILTIQSALPWGPSDGGRTDYTGTGDITLGAGGSTPWNYSGPKSAFSGSLTPIPCSGTFSFCTPYPKVGAVSQPSAECVAAAQAPYAGNPQLQGMALASLTNAACYVKDGGVLTPPAYGTLGNAGKNQFRGHPYNNVDLTVAKVWKVGERYSAQLRFEFFNFFNRPDFAAGSTGGSGTDVALSRATSAGLASYNSTPDASNAVLGSGGPRHIQFGLKLGF